VIIELPPHLEFKYSIIFDTNKIILQLLKNIFFPQFQRAISIARLPVTLHWRYCREVLLSADE